MLRRHPLARKPGPVFAGTGLALGLLIPAVQRVRDAAARTADT
jgi:hypothetical protein